MMLDDAIGLGNGRPEPATVMSLRQRSRAQVLAYIVGSGTVTRAQLAEVTGLSQASVTKIVADLIDDGHVVETGTRASRGGRPIAELAPRADKAFFLGADVGERGVAVELFDFAMNPIDREFRGGRVAESVDGIVDDIRQAYQALRERHENRWPAVRGIGLGLPGVVEGSPDTEQTLFAQPLGWSATSLHQVLDLDTRVFADNGANTLARAERWFGALRGIDHAVVPLLGRGVGLAVVVEGRLLRGAFGTAVEWGHTVIHPGGRECSCGGRGCLEAYVGADAILDQWRERGGQVEGSGWRALGAFLEAAKQADSAASDVLDEVVANLGAALGGLVNMFNPQVAVIGGWVGERLMAHCGERLDQQARTVALKRLGSQYTLHAATFGGDTVAVGAAAMPLEALIRGEVL